MNQFINIAVAEKLGHLQHEEWLVRRPKITHALIAKALDALDRPTGRSPEEFDKIPAGYRLARRGLGSERTTGRHRA